MTLVKPKPNFRGQRAGLLAGVIGLSQFHRWSWDNAAAIEQHGGDEEVALLTLVLHRFAEDTSNCIAAAQLLDAFQTDPFAKSEPATSASTGYGM